MNVVNIKIISLYLICFFSVFVPNISQAVVNDSRCFVELDDYAKKPKTNPQILFKHQGIEYNIKAMGNIVGLYKNEVLLDQLEINQGHEGFGIVGLAQISNDLLFVDGYYSDFLLEVSKNLLHSLELNEVNFELLYRWPISYLQRLEGMVLGDFDVKTREGILQKTRALKGAFIHGYRYSFFNGWFDWYNKEKTRYLITKNGTKKLPKEIAEAKRYVGELVKVDPDKDTKHSNGVLFESKSGQLLFYNGQKVTVLLKDHNRYRMEKTKSGKLRRVAVNEWYVKNMPNLGPVIYTDKDDQSIVYTLTAGPKLLKLAEKGIKRNRFQIVYFKFKGFDALFYNKKYEIHMVSAGGDETIYKSACKYNHEFARDSRGIVFAACKGDSNKKKHFFRFYNTPACQQALIANESRD